MNLTPVEEHLTLARDVRPDEDYFVFFAATVSFYFAGGDGRGGGEGKLESDATFGAGDVLAAAFGSVVDLVGRVVGGVILLSAGGWHG